MDFLLTLISFIFVLGVTVFIHELGHFLFAKKAGIYVYEFSIGMGPRIFSFQKKETVYAIRLFPIGGFVSMAGESVEEDEKIPKEKRMQSKKWHERFLTVVAGVFFNFLLAFVIFIVVACIAGPVSKDAYIASLEEGYAAIDTNLQVGDKVVGMNGFPIYSSDHLLLEMQVRTGKVIHLEVEHENQKREVVTLTPKEEKEDGETVYRYGFSLIQPEETGFLAPLKYAVNKVISLTHQMILVLFYLFTGKLGLGALSGPVGIFSVIGETAKTGFLNLIYLIGFISINVGFLNLLPIPAFDGGRLFFLVIEKIKGSPVDPNLENTIHAIGLFLLMILMVIVTITDIMKLG